MRSRTRTFGILLVGIAIALAAAIEVALPRLRVRATILSRRNSSAEEEEQRRIRDPRDDVAEIYGIPVGRSDLEVLLVDADRFVIPREAPERRLLLVAPGEAPPLQARTVRYAGHAAAAGLALIGLLLYARARRRARVEPGAPPTPRPVA